MARNSANNGTTSIDHHLPVSHRVACARSAVSVQRAGQDLRLRQRSGVCGRVWVPVPGWLMLLFGGSLEVPGSLASAEQYALQFALAVASYCGDGDVVHVSGSIPLAAPTGLDKFWPFARTSACQRLPVRRHQRQDATARTVVHAGAASARMGNLVYRRVFDFCLQAFGSPVVSSVVMASSSAPLEDSFRSHPETPWAAAATGAQALAKGVAVPVGWSPFSPPRRDRSVRIGPSAPSGLQGLQHRSLVIQVASATGSRFAAAVTMLSAECVSRVGRVPAAAQLL